MAAARKPAAKKAPTARPVLQWITAGLGLIITLAAIAVLTRDALEPARPAMLSARVVRTTASPAGWVVEVDVHNSGGDAAAAVRLEGAVAGQTASVVIDHAPGDGSVRAFLRFAGQRPTAAPTLRVTGWTEP